MSYAVFNTKRKERRMSLFSERLRELRTKKGKTQQEMADLVGVNRATYSSYERDVSVPPYEKAKVFADYLNVNVDFLMGRSSDRCVRRDEGVDIVMNLTMVLDMLDHEDSPISNMGQPLTARQREGLKPVIKNAIEMIDLIMKYDD